MYFVYFLRSETNPDEPYIGFTENLVKRLREHNEGEGPAHTRRYRPWVLEAFILADTRENARLAEAYFKNTSGKEKFKRFAESNPDHPNPVQGFFDSINEEHHGFGRGENRFHVLKGNIIIVGKRQN